MEFLPSSRSPVPEIGGGGFHEANLRMKTHENGVLIRARGFAGQAVLLLLLLLSPAGARAQCLLDWYWPMHDGDHTTFTNRNLGGAGNGSQSFSANGTGFILTQATSDATAYLYLSAGTNQWLMSEIVQPGTANLSFNTPLIFLSENLIEKGGSISSSSAGTIAVVGNGEVPVNVTLVVTVAKAGTVTVPAGTYLNCLSVQFKLTASANGRTAAETINGFILAPGAGMVQQAVYSATGTTVSQTGWSGLSGGEVGGAPVASLAALGGLAVPAFTLQPKPTTATQYGGTSFQAAATGGALQYQWQFNGNNLSDGVNISGSASNLLVINPVQPTNAGVYSVTVVNPVCSAVSANAVLTVVPDTTPPVVSITNLPAGLVVSNAAFTVRGAASDNTTVSNVWYSFNGGAWTSATAATPNWSSWAAGVTLAPGTNTLQARGVDLSGNLSPIAAGSVDYVVSARLTVQTNPPGWGAISPNDNGAALALGTVYKLTATAAAGFAFTNWTAAGLTLTNGKTLAFTMVTNLVLTANFADITPPTLSITNLPAGLAVSNAGFTVRGIARDNVAVSNVLYSLNGAPWTSATTPNNGSNWTATVTLNPGTNTVMAYAVDSSGNQSPTVTNRVTYVVSAALIVQIIGSGTVSPNYNGALLQVGRNYSMTAIPAKGCVLTNWKVVNFFLLTNTDFNEMGQPVSTNTSIIPSVLPGTNDNPTLNFEMFAPMLLYISTVTNSDSATNSTITEQRGYQAIFADVTPPAVAITSPTANQQLATNSFLIRGTAGDNVAVASVWYQINGGGWQNPAGTNNWTAAVALNPGTNTVMAYAVDSSGNASPTNTVNFVEVVKAALTVQISGNGTVSPSYNGASLQIGENYSLTAKPAAGFAFTNWSSVRVPSILTNSPTLTFAMSSGLTLEASFVDIAPPTVAITAPVPNLQVSNALYTVTGTAKDNVAVAYVYYSLNGSAWAAASAGNNRANWTAAVTLSPGTNVIAAYAEDPSGNISAVVSNRLDYWFVPGGVWNVVKLATPGQMTWDATNGLLGGGNFSVTNGTLVLNPDGTLSGGLGNPFTGSYTMDGGGRVAAQIVTGYGTNDDTLFINASQDTMILADTDTNGNDQELLIFERAPAARATIALTGSWNAVQFQTPAQITGETPDGLTGGHDFAATNGTLTLAANGTLSGNLGGVFTGAYAVSSNGAVNVVLFANGATNHSRWWLNAGQDTLATVDRAMGDTNHPQRLWLFERAPAAVTKSNLAGWWNVTTFTTPAQMSLDPDQGLLGGEDFGMNTGTMTLDASGNLSGYVNGAFTGVCTIGGNGLITAAIITDGATNHYTLYLNAGRDTMTTVDTRSGTHENTQEIILFQRAPQ